MRGTPFTPGQFAKIASEVTIALPRALAEYDPKAVLLAAQGSGKLLSHLLHDMFGKLLRREYLGEVFFLIDTDEDPEDYHEFQVVFHQPMSKLNWLNKDAVKLHCVKAQATRAVAGYELRDELRDAKIEVLNVKVLEHLLENPWHYPEPWRENTNGEPLTTFFWGTIYENYQKQPTVRGLTWLSDRKCIHQVERTLAHAFGPNDRAAVRLHQ